MILDAAIKFTHAQFKDNDGNPVAAYILPEQVFAVHHLPSNNCTAIMGGAGSYVPVLETVEQVLEKLNKKPKQEA